MEELLNELEAMRITGNVVNDNLWKSCVHLSLITLVPEKNIGKDRPCEEKDYREYRQLVNRNLRNLESTLRHIVALLNEQNRRDAIFNSNLVRNFIINLIVVIGEQSEKAVWNNAESVSIAGNLARLICDFFQSQSISNLLMSQGEGSDNIFSMVIVALRPRLLKETWKAYPAAVNCYKWILSQLEEPNLIRYMNDVVPTALIILDDYILENRLIGIRCIEIILRHGNMRKELVDTGYLEVIYDALKKLLTLREAAYIYPLYNCISILLRTSEYYESTNCLEWTRRDDVLSSLLGNMEYEPNLELRHAYMRSLPGLLTNVGCAKWCERLARILSEYCEHHTDLKTLKVTMEAARTFLLKFESRVPTHCVSLYAAFLKLHMDLVETPIFDKEIVQNLEDCISLLYKLTPSIGKKIISDDRMKSVINHQLQFKVLNGITYFE